MRLVSPPTLIPLPTIEVPVVFEAKRNKRNYAGAYFISDNPTPRKPTLKERILSYLDNPDLKIK